MPSSDGCEHANLELGSRVDTVIDDRGRWLSMSLNVRCSGCGVLFSWSGVNSGLPNPLEPVVSADGYELRAPIAPRPGAAVGMLMMAGLEDRLLNPDHRE